MQKCPKTCDRVHTDVEDEKTEDVVEADAKDEDGVGMPDCDMDVTVNLPIEALSNTKPIVENQPPVVAVPVSHNRNSYRAKQMKLFAEWKEHVCFFLEAYRTFVVVNSSIPHCSGIQLGKAIACNCSELQKSIYSFSQVNRVHNAIIRCTKRIFSSKCPENA